MGSSKSSKSPKMPEPAPVIAPVQRENEEVRKSSDIQRRKAAQTSRQRSNLVQSYSSMATNRQTTGGM